MPTDTMPVQAPSDTTQMLPKKLAHSRPLFDGEILRRAIGDSFAKLCQVHIDANTLANELLKPEYGFKKVERGAGST